MKRIFAVLLIICCFLTGCATNNSSDTNDENVESTVKVDMVTQFEKIGFTTDEANKAKAIFETVGISEINNIQIGGGSSIDVLQAFKCDIYDHKQDKGGISLSFTVENRQIVNISVNGIATTNVDYAYINLFGNLKFKTSNGKKSVTLYDVWDENGEIDPNAVGYLAVFDNENNSITAYE